MEHVYFSPFFFLLGICLYGVFALTRFSVSLGLLERPLVIAFFWGLFTGEFSTAFALGICCELFLIDDLNVGTRIPTSGTLPLLLSLVLINFSELGFFSEEPQYFAPVLVCAMPFALLGRQAELFVRTLQVREHTLFVEKRRGAAIPGYIFFIILGRLLAIQTLVFCLSFAILGGIFLGFKRITGELPVLPGINWYILWAISAIGGYISLRTKRAYLVVSACLILALFTYL